MKARRRPKGGRPKAQVQAGVVERMGLICMSETSVPGSGSAFYYGMDVSLYPGDAAMQAWWNASPFCYTGFYLAPAPYHQDASWMSKRQVLINQSWGFMPVYVGRQADSSYLDTATGANEAEQAASLARCAGFPCQTTIYLDIETPHPLTGRHLAYVVVWVNELRNKGYQAGIYCNADNASQIKGALFGSVEFWAAHYIGCGLPSSVPSPACSGASFAGTWQFAGDINMTYGGYPITVDLNTSIYTDPSRRSRSLINKR